MFWIRKYPFLSQKTLKSIPKFFFKCHNFGQRYHNLRFSIWHEVENDTPFLFHFYVTISPKFLIPIFSQDSSIQVVLEKSCFQDFSTSPQNFFASQGTPKEPLLGTLSPVWPFGTSKQYNKEFFKSHCHLLLNSLLLKKQKIWIL